jgi:type III restriction enzyme
LHPPGRDVRCIISVGMLTEGWDCNTVTHIIGLRPFMSQLLCEQVVGRGLRRANYTLDPETNRFPEEVAQIFGVPFEIIPFKANVSGTPPKPKRHRVHALPSKVRYRIEFPRVEGYTQAIRNRVALDWQNESPIHLDPTNIPSEVQMKATLPANSRRPCLHGPGKIKHVTLNPFRAKKRKQELVFDLTGTLTRSYIEQGHSQLCAHVLFPQLMNIVAQYLDEKVIVHSPADLMDVFLAPYYGWVVERLQAAIRPDVDAGEASELPKYERHRGPGSTDDVDFFTSRDVREVLHCHLNYVVADTKKWEQAAAYFIDTHPAVDAFVKNEGLGFAIPYFHNGQNHDYMPDFVLRLKSADKETNYLILETKGFDPLAEVKRAAALRWTKAVDTDGRFGYWRYAMAKNPNEVVPAIEAASRGVG